MRPDWLLLSTMHAARSALRRKRPSTPRVAGVLPVKDYSDECSAFESLRALSDVTIVLDDNSSTPFPYRAECDEYLTLSTEGLWNHVANQTLLMYRAFVHGCDWVVTMDDDIVFSHGFQTRADVRSLIDALSRKKVEICIFPLRDLWGSTRRFRADGVWGRKTFGVLRRNWFFYPNITIRDPSRRLHTPLFPTNLRPRRLIFERHTAYHTGCYSPAARLARVGQYRVEDPENTFQRDYDYMLSEEGIRIEPVPAEDVRILDAKVRVPAEKQLR